MQDCPDDLITLPEAEKLSEQIGCHVRENDLKRYAEIGRLAASKKGGVWFTTHVALRDLIASLLMYRYFLP